MIERIFHELGEEADLQVISIDSSEIKAHKVSAFAEKLISQIDFNGSTILADKAYGKWELREFIAKHDADYCTPPTSNNIDPWFVNWWLCKECHLVKTFFLKL